MTDDAQLVDEVDQSGSETERYTPDGYWPWHVYLENRRQGQGRLRALAEIPIVYFFAFLGLMVIAHVEKGAEEEAKRIRRAKERGEDIEDWEEVLERDSR